ncbi:MAG TPA: large conductance mechanosensitive channel protein MscL [Acidimicrobiales bacterium]|nr:large conductance mechanosensitive channel protein MscL [Acidimicrobiales bacterium]
MLEDFKDFVMKGNVLDLAVAVVIGAAFGAVIQSLVDNVINPIIAGVVGQPDISSVATFTIGSGEDASVVSFGAWFNQILSFVIIAFVLFIIIRAFEQMQNRRGAGAETEGAGPTEVDLLTEIRDSLKTQS